MAQHSLHLNLWRPDGACRGVVFRVTGIRVTLFQRLMLQSLAWLLAAGGTHTVCAQPPQPVTQPSTPLSPVAPARAQQQAAGTVPAADQAADQAAHAEVLRLQEQLTADLQRQLTDFAEINDQSPAAVMQYSRRGDLHMFLGQFAEAVRDYRRMVTLDAATDASHWRLGIALFFAGEPADAAAQFDKYHAFDNVDRENGIWRYLSHYRAYGAERARAELLRYEKDDRPPFPEVYRLFDGSLTAAQVLAAIPDNLPESDRQARRFYSDLYVGFHALVQGQREPARSALRRAVLNPWPRTSGYGPHYMWHVGRLQYMQLQSGTATSTAD